MSDDANPPELQFDVTYFDNERVNVKAKLESLSLSGGKQIPITHCRLHFGKLGTKGRLKRLQDAGMPIDLNRWTLVIDGRGMEHPEFTFHFLGVVTPGDGSRLDAETTMPIVTDVSDRAAKKTVARLLLGYVWERVVRLRTSNALLIEIFDPSHVIEPESKTGWALAAVNLGSDVLTVKQRADVIRKLAQGYELMAEVVEAFSKQHGGGPTPRATPDPESVRLWSAQYDDATASLENELASRQYRQFSKYTRIEKPFIIKRAFPNAPTEVVNALAELKTLADVAIEYTGWKCSKVPVKTWKPDRYQDFLRDSDRLNNRTRSGRK